MKINRAKTYVSAIAVAAIVLSAGTFYAVQNLQQGSDTVQAYTSTENPVDPATAPDSYVVNIPDANLKKALNAVLTRLDQTTNPAAPVRANDAAITAGDLKRPVNMYGPLGLDGKSITNLEGAQFLVNAGTISLSGNQITNVAPLADLTNVKVLTLSRNQIADVTPLAQISSLETLALELNQTLTTVAPLATAPKLKELNITSTKVSDLTPIASIATLEKLHMRNLLISPAKINLTPIASHPKLAFIDANSNRLTGSELAVMKNAPVLATFMTAGNNVLNLQDFLNSGFTTLHQSSTFSAQTHSINTGNNPLIANPVRGINGELIPVVETATVKNADADGTLNPNGAYIKLVDTYGNGTVNVAWTKSFSYNNIVNREFSGTIAVRYTMPARDTVAPTFSPASPAKITSRKGIAININDVTATDNTGGSGVNAAGVTNNAAAINLDAANPAAGNYTLTYSVSDNQNNTRTVNRQIEITDADALQTKVDSTTDTMLDNGGYTAESITEVRARRQAAQTVIANNGATQAQIDQALSDLNTALGQLTVSTQPIDTVITDEYNAAPDYIKNEAGVAAAFAQANNTKNDPARTKQTVQQAADNLHNAIEAAKNAEAARQTTARDALQTATNDKTPNAFNDAQAAIAAVQDPTVKAQLQAQLDTLKNDYNAKKTELQDKVNDTTDASLVGYIAATVDAVKAKRQAAEAVLANSNASQAQIEQALSDLNNAIAALAVDNAPITNIIENEYNISPDHIKNDAGVAEAYRRATSKMNDANRTPAEVAQAAQDLHDAITSAINAESVRQVTAMNAVNDANVNRNPVYFETAQNAIDRVLDPDVKRQLQTRLDSYKDEYNSKRNELNALIAKVELPETTDGMTSATVAALQNELAQAKAANVPNIDQATVQQLIDDLQAALDALRADKQPLLDAIALEATQPDYIKNNPAVVATLAEANTVNSQANPTVADVRARAQALRDAIAAAIQVETTARNNAESALDSAYDALNDPNLGPADMPNIDLVAIENKINAVQDPATKQDLIDDFNQLKAALAARKAQVDAYIASQQNQSGQNSQGGSSSQNQSGASGSVDRLSDSGEGLAPVAVGGVLIALGGVALLARKLRG